MTNRERASKLYEQACEFLLEESGPSLSEAFEQALNAAEARGRKRGREEVADFCANFSQERIRQANEGADHPALLLAEASGARLCELSIRALAASEADEGGDNDAKG